MYRIVPSVRPFGAVVLSLVLLSCSGSDGTGVDEGDAIASVGVTPPSVTLDIGDTRQLTATVRNGRGEVVQAQVSWSSGGTAASVTGTGLVTGVAEGSAVVTATAGGKVGTATVTVNDPSPPAAPSTVQAQPSSNTAVTVSWTDNSDDEDEFRVEREPVGGAAAAGTTARAFTQVGAVGRDVTSFEDTGLEPETGYRYRVRACNDNGCSDPSGPSGGATTFATLVVETAVLPDGFVDEPYETTLVASGGDASTVWSVSAGGLPPPLELTGATGVISGTPDTQGEYAFTVRAEGAGQAVTVDLSITVRDALLPPRVTTTSLDDAGVGAAYEETLEATDGNGEYTWAVAAGALPGGLSLDAVTGGIGGTPTSAGVSAITVEVSSAGMTGTADLSITVHDALEVTTASLPDGVEGQGYEETLVATGGNGDDTWSLESGSLPDGLALDAGGRISGSPAAASGTGTEGPAAVTGRFDFTVRVENPLGQAATRALSITVNAVLEITTTGLPDGRVGVAYGQTVASTGGDGSTTWSVVSGALPDGLGIDPSTGEITGTPGSAGIFDFTVRVSSGDGQMDQQALSITVASAPVAITTSTLPDGAVGAPYDATLQATGGDGSYTWARIGGDELPDGLSLDGNTGAISGTPTTSGTWSFTVEVTSDGQTDGRALSITITAPPVAIDTDYLVTAYPGAAYSDVVEASGGDGSYDYAVTGGSPPDGLSLDPSTGELDGIAGTPGAYFFTVTVTSAGTMASKTYAVAISTAAAGAFNLGIMNVAGNTIPSSDVIQRLSEALAKWEEVIVGNLGSWSYGPDDWSAGSCGGEGPRMNDQTVHDMLVMVDLAPIDGVGGTLGSAGPCDARIALNPLNFATIFGRLRLDTSDLAGLDTHQLYALIFHEIGHIVGIGTLWGIYSQLGGTDLIDGAGTADPRYTGAGGNGVYTGALGGGSSGMETRIPIEADGGPGTADGHWDEGEFDREMMTGYSEASGATQPVSEMTIAAVGDFAYDVDTGVAEAYAIPGCAPACNAAPAAPGTELVLLDDILDEPIRLSFPDGTVVWVDPGRAP